MKLVQVAEQNKKYYTKEFIHGFNTGAKTQYEADRKEAEREGRWILDFGGKFKGGAYWFRCSRCGRIVPNVRNGGWNYCPNCGARMVEE